MKSNKFALLMEPTSKQIVEDWSAGRIEVLGAVINPAHGTDESLVSCMSISKEDIETAGSQ